MTKVNKPACACRRGNSTDYICPMHYRKGRGKYA